MLRSSAGLRVGRLLGFPIYVDFTLLLLVGTLALWHIQGGLAAFGRALVFFGVLIGGVVVHELGHALAVRRLHMGDSIIVLSGLGGQTVYQASPSPRNGILVALAGPMAGLGLGLLAWPLVRYLAPTLPPMAGYALELFVVVSVLLNLGNLLPVFPLDGGQVLRFGLMARLPWHRAMQATVAVGSVFLAGAAGVLWWYAGFDAVFAWLIVAIVAGENVRLWRRASSE